MEQKGHVNNLLEDGWFFGNSLLCRSKSSKIMLRCNSDPSPSSSSKEVALVSNDQDHSSKMSNLLRTPSLPVTLGRDTKYELLEEEGEDDEEEPRMGDLIRQAMPMPVPRRRLVRTPSLPPCRVKESSRITARNDQIGSNNAEKLSRKVSMDSSVLLPEKGPLAMTKLTRRASIDSYLLLPPKCSTSKGSKLSTSNSKNRPQRKLEPSNINIPPRIETKNHNLDKSKSMKSLCDLEIEELQGFKDLGFSFDENKDLSPSVTQVLPALQRRASLDSNHVDLKVRRPYLSEAWQSPLCPKSAPPVPKRGDQNGSSSADMKNQIKFWARAVASNVRQEC